MRAKKKLVIGLLVGLSFAGTVATEQAVNLKVLPKNIGEHELDNIMVKDFGEALGVKCEYCHVKDKSNDRFDYASDALAAKDTARSMMRMTIDLNRKNFFRPTAMIGGKDLVVTCYTCHRGDAIPK